MVPLFTLKRNDQFRIYFGDRNARTCSWTSCGCEEGEHQRTNARNFYLNHWIDVCAFDRVVKTNGGRALVKKTKVLFQTRQI